jgi:hypothetical protein
MKKQIKITVATLTTLTLLLSGCGSDDSSSSETLDLESAKKVLYFYGASSDEHYAYFVESNTIENLNDDAKTDMSGTNPSGRLFVWVDDRGDTNISNDEGKVVMFKSDYVYASDNNATWEDFYYLDHLSGDARHPHDNIEFDPNRVGAVPGDSKALAMMRLNMYMGEQEQLKQDLANVNNSEGNAIMSVNDICDFYTTTHEHEGAIEKMHFVLGKNGALYTYENEEGTIAFKDSTVVSDSCEVGKSGMSAAQEGVLIYLGTTSKLYLVDSHDGGDSHVHSTWDLSEVLGDGKSIDMMVGIGALEHDQDGYDHEHE